MRKFSSHIKNVFGCKVDTPSKEVTSSYHLSMISIHPREKLRHFVALGIETWYNVKLPYIYLQTPSIATIVATI